MLNANGKIVVEFIHPPHPNSVEDKLDPPLGILTIASYLQHLFSSVEVEVRVTDLSGLSEEDWDIGKADVYGITVYVTSLSVMDKIIEKCKSRNPNSIIVVGGAHPSAVPDSPNFSNVDYVVVGEGEYPMYILIKNLLNGKSMLNKIIISPHKPESTFLFPSFELVDVNAYRRTIDGRKSLPLLTSRGCPFECSFCGLNKFHELNKTVRFASPENIYSQVMRIMAEFSIEAINFQDDIFTLDHKRLFRMLDLLKCLGIKFRCHGRAGGDTEEVYDRLADSGCSMMAWGIESGSQYILDRMNKKAKVEDNLNVITWAKKYGITARAFFIIGFPGETKESLEETKRFIERSEPDQVFVSSFVPYPGTDVWNNPDKYGIKQITNDWDQFYQVGKDGTGGLTIDTEWLGREEFRELEIEFRSWIHENFKFKGSMLDYEKELYKKEEMPT